MRLDPGVQRLSAYEERGGDFGFSVPFRGKFENAIAIGGHIAGGASALSRRQDFEIGAHKTSQNFAKFVMEKAQLYFAMCK
jgi:hypothetical protein